MSSFLFGAPETSPLLANSSLTESVPRPTSIRAASFAASSTLTTPLATEPVERRGSYVGPASNEGESDIWNPQTRTVRAESEGTLLLSRSSEVEEAKSPIAPTLTLDNGVEANTTTLHLGDLDTFQMDEAYIRECCARMGWEGVTSIKLVRGNSPATGYCFLTFPTAAHAAQVLARFNTNPPALMPRSTRVFKLNWGTGIPGVQPRWEGEHSVFVGDLGREVGEAELVSLFTPIFPSTKSAKIMYDPSTGVSRGYGFVRFSEESDMQRALVLGQNAGSGLSLHGRTLRISEASGPNNPIDAQGRERSRSRSEEDGLSPLMVNGGAYGNYGQPEVSPGNAYINGPNDFRQQAYPSQYAQTSPNSQQFAGGPGYGGRGGPMSPGMGYGHPQQQMHHQQQHSNGQSHTTDPNNTTVFVGGLPACISEETLKSFFHHFGEITYCKIPTGKGCGFVQFVRRSDAELAIAKMNDFPIHGKSRIRLSWGRSQGDKQVEHVRKLASALGVPFEAVWRMVQGQDNSTIKQITTAVGGTTPVLNRFEALGMGMGRMELGAVASAAGLTEAEVLELVGGRGASTGGASEGYGSTNGGGSDFFARSSASAGSLDSSANGGPYSRASPASFSAFPASGQPGLPLSPPASANYSQNYMQQQQSGYAPSPYQSNAYGSQYERQDFGDAGARNRGGPADRFNNAGYPAYGGRYQSQQSGYDSHARQNSYNNSQAYDQQPNTNLEDSFAGMNMGFASSSLPPRNGSAQQNSFTGAAQDFFPASKNGEFLNPVGSEERLGAHWA